ncbi:hypothetical protein ACKI16_29700 [Streptomyces scabiei]|uniref:hypothetical protein n=1 Tax=Streptomyces scabiei TaxID=1930 RepID=UPI0038F64F5E
MTTATVTSTHAYIPFANPYLQCTQCGAWLTGFHEPETCGCTTFETNVPCCCRAGIRSACPSWSPVEGCLCAESFGHVDHSAPPTLTEAGR